MSKAASGDGPARGDGREGGSGAGKVRAFTALLVLLVLGSGELLDAEYQEDPVRVIDDHGVHYPHEATLAGVRRLVQRGILEESRAQRLSLSTRPLPRPRGASNCPTTRPRT